MRSILEEFSSGKFQSVIKRSEKALKRDPKSAFLNSMLGLSLLQTGKAVKALTYLERANRLEPSPESKYNLGCARLKTGDCKNARELFREYTDSKGSDPEGWTNLGNAILAADGPSLAISAFERAYSLCPHNKSYAQNLALCLADADRIREALELFEQLVQASPDDGRVIGAYATFLARIKRVEHAFAWAQHALTLTKDDPDISFLIARLIIENNIVADPKPYLIQAFCKKSILPSASEYFFRYLVAETRFDEAKAHIENLLKSRLPIASVSRLIFESAFVLAMKTFDWSWYEKLVYLTNLNIVHQGNFLSSFDAAHAFDDASLLSQAIENSASRIQGLSQGPFLLNKSGAQLNKIRIAFFSGEFCRHPVGTLLIAVIEALDRSRFEIVFFSSTESDDEITIRYRAVADSFFDVKNLNDWELCDLARSQRLDIGFDLNGPTGKSRSNVFYERIAKVQISFLGFPFSTGSKNIDYILLDKTVFSSENASLFSEKLIDLGRCFMPRNDQVVPLNDLSRLRYGLPEQAPLFCCFNKVEKITKETLSVWCDIANETGGILWFSSRVPDVAFERIIAFCTSRGLEPQQCVRSGEVGSAEEHLGRHRLADLYLDTFPYGGHTSFSDAIYSGLPAITRYGNSPVSRVGLSMLTHLGLEGDLAVADFDSYRKLAVALTRDDTKLFELREKIEARSLSTKLFDSKDYAVRFTEAVLSVHERVSPKYR